MFDRTFQRFLDAQKDPMMGWVIDELKAGHKKSHWMWFIFPQAYGLGESHNSKLYGIRSLEEALEYWEHPLLGSRLQKCIELAIDSGKPALELFGKEIDAMKFQSCLTLFIQVDRNNQLLQSALHHFYKGELDIKTLKVIQKAK